MLLRHGVPCWYDINRQFESPYDRPKLEPSPNKLYSLYSRLVESWIFSWEGGTKNMEACVGWDMIVERPYRRSAWHQTGFLCGEHFLFVLLVGALSVCVMTSLPLKNRAKYEYYGRLSVHPSTRNENKKRTEISITNSEEGSKIVSVESDTAAVHDNLRGAATSVHISAAL